MGFFKQILLLFALIHYFNGTLKLYAQISERISTGVSMEVGIPVGMFKDVQGDFSSSGFARTGIGDSFFLSARLLPFLSVIIQSSSVYYKINDKAAMVATGISTDFAPWNVEQILLGANTVFGINKNKSLNLQICGLAGIGLTSQPYPLDISGFKPEKKSSFGFRFGTAIQYDLSRIIRIFYSLSYYQTNVHFDSFMGDIGADSNSPIHMKVSTLCNNIGISILFGKKINEN